MECNAEVDQQAFVCPKCGSETLMGSYDTEDAESMIDIEKNKVESGKHVDRSNELAQQGQYAEAIKEAKIALEIAPLNPNAHNNIGACLVEQGKPKEAIPWLQKAIKLNPKHECASIWLEQARSSSSISQGHVTSKTGNAGTTNDNCFIATVCYGDQYCKEVMILRNFRDTRLMLNNWGRNFIRLYYKYSPHIANWLSRHPMVCSFIRKNVLNTLVKSLKNLNVS
jgi:tetratricopeptide (TPR) repeat protein